MVKKRTMQAVLFDVGGVLVSLGKLKEKAFAAFGVADRDQFWRLYNEIEPVSCRRRQRRDLARRPLRVAPNGCRNSILQEDIFSSKTMIEYFPGAFQADCGFAC